MLLLLLFVCMFCFVFVFVFVFVYFCFFVFVVTTLSNFQPILLLISSKVLGIIHTKFHHKFHQIWGEGVMLWIMSCTFKICLKTFSSFQHSTNLINPIIDYYMLLKYCHSVLSYCNNKKTITATLP